MEVSGKIKWIDEVKTYGESGFRKRQVVITTQEQYPQSLLIEFIQDKCNLLDNFQLGQSVKIGINLRGREWTDKTGAIKYFNTLDVWRIVSEDSGLERPPIPTFLESNEGDGETLPF